MYGVVEQFNLAGSGAWALGGNAVTTTQNFGTATNYDVPVIANNTEVFRFGVDGNTLATGTTTSQYNYSRSGAIEGRWGASEAFGGVVCGSTSNSYVYFTIAGTAVAALNTVGYLGVGTLYASSRLHLSGTGELGAAIQLQDTGTSGGNFSITPKANGTAGTFGIGDGNAFAYRLIISSTGNVGVGQTNPAYNLDGYATGLYWRMIDPSINANGFLLSPQNGSGSHGFSLYDANASVTRFAINNVGNASIGASIVFNSSLCNFSVVNANHTLASDVFTQAILSTDTYAIDKGGSLGFGGKYDSNGNYTVFGSISGRKSNGTDGNYGGYLLFATRENGTGAQVEAFRITNNQYIQFGAASTTANGTVATALTALGPTGASTTVQEWLTIKNSAGVIRYIPCF